MSGASQSPPWPARVAHGLYSLLLYAITPAVLLRLFLLGFRHPGYRHDWRQRFGFVPAMPAPAVWIHAVSVGEVQAAVPLIKRLRNGHPALRVLLTTTTPTGADAVRRTFGAEVTHCYLPYDLPGAVARFLGRVRPAAAIMMETELWPNLVAACRRRFIPMILVNGRLSARSAAGYRRYLPVVAEMMGSIAAIAAQTPADAERFIGLGAAAERVVVTGSMKFDVELPADIASRSQAVRNLLGVARPVWIAASTHAGEEDAVLDAFRLVRDRIPEVLLVLAPRHPDRAERLALLCAQRGWTAVRRTIHPESAAAADVFILDTLGELPAFYAASDLAFIGGSLVPVGGHNPLEAAAAGIAILTGPHTFNFEAIDRMLLQAGAATRVHGAGELGETAVRLLAEPDRRRNMGETGRQVVEANRGAATKVMALLEPFLRVSV